MTMQTNGQSLLTARQVQTMFGVDRSTVYRMAEDGRLPAIKIGRQWRFRPEEIERLLVASPGAAMGNGTPPARTGIDTSRFERSRGSERRHMGVGTLGPTVFNRTCITCITCRESNIL